MYSSSTISLLLLYGGGRLCCAFWLTRCEMCIVHTTQSLCSAWSIISLRWLLEASKKQTGSNERKKYRKKCRLTDVNKTSDGARARAQKVREMKSAWHSRSLLSSYSFSLNRSIFMWKVSISLLHSARRVRRISLSINVQSSNLYQRMCAR